MQLGDLEIEVRGKNPLQLVLRGKSNHREPESILGPFFAEILPRLNGPGAALELHFEELEFFNSSTITSVIHFIKDLGNRRVTTSITYDPSRSGQKVFFDALRMLQKTDGLLKINPASP
jgi:hypothetical protein